MKRLALLLSLVACAALAQGVVRGGALKKRQYRTYSNLTLYVNGEFGSDSNSCTDQDAGACLTIQGALEKFPNNLYNTVRIEVAGRSDGGVLDYAGFNVGKTTHITPTGTNGSLSIRGAMGLVVDAGTTTNLLVVSYDGGGYRTDGGTPIYDESEFNSITVAGGDWVDGGLRRFFAAAYRADGGLYAYFPIADNTASTLFFAPTYQRSAASFSPIYSINITEPKTRFTSNRPGTGTGLISQSPPRFRSTVTVQYFDFVPVNGTPIGLLGNGASLSLTNSRIWYGIGADSFSSPPAGATLNISGSYLYGGSSRYLVADGSVGSQISLTSNVVQGASKSLFTRPQGSQWFVVGNDFRNISSLWALPSGFLSVSHISTVYSNRFIDCIDGIDVIGFDGQSRLEVHSNLFKDLTGNAISLYGDVTLWTNTSSGTPTGSECINVAGYGIYLERGAKTNWIPTSSFYGGSCAGTLGAVSLDGTAYTSATLDGLSVFPAGQRCITGLQYGTRVCLGDY